MQQQSWENVGDVIARCCISAGEVGWVLLPIAAASPSSAATRTRSEAAVRSIVLQLVPHARGDRHALVRQLCVLCEGEGAPSPPPMDPDDPFVAARGAPLSQPESVFLTLVRSTALRLFCRLSSHIYGGRGDGHDAGAEASAVDKGAGTATKSAVLSPQRDHEAARGLQRDVGPLIVNELKSEAERFRHAPGAQCMHAIERARANDAAHARWPGGMAPKPAPGR